MSKPKTFQVLVGCQVQECAEEVSHHLSMLRWWNDRPICENCFDEERCEFQAKATLNAKPLRWSDLKPLTIKQARA